MDHRKETEALRSDSVKHYNCCQSVLIPFAQTCGLDAEGAEKLGAHFGSGMRYGGTCGAVTGALMVLGLAGKDEAAARELQKRFRERNVCLDCADLLRRARENGEERKPHCDRMVYDAVEFLDEML